jgi:hypothetical protein
MMIRRHTVLAVLAVSLLAASCEKDDPVNPNEEELITTVGVLVLENGTSNEQLFSFRDPDGEGGSPPIAFDSIIIDANKTYTVAIGFLDESKSPAKDITEEISEEAADHQIYYEPRNGVAINVSGLDTDPSGLPLGLISTWNAGAPGKGSMRITLKHKPGSKAAGDPVTKGETDVEVEFGVRLK